VSWQLLSTALVIAALVTATGWYERSRPSSRLVSLVAALAALAVAGRVVFAPIPNVQATTDVVLLSGYALGAAPGFAIGASGALVSNFFLGQGPWTPWQMLGWGAIGVFGAALAHAGVARRWPLALACGIAGFAFGAWMDLFTLLTFTAEQSFDTYLVVAAASLPFNVAHAAGNLLICLLLGPAFVRLVRRFRMRFEIKWGPAPAPNSGGRGEPPRHGLPEAGGARATAATLVLVALVLPAAVHRAEASAESSAAVRYLERAQNRDGGFGAAPGQASSQLQTGWAVLGLEAGGRHPLAVRSAGRSPIDFMRANVRQLSDTGEIERTILALTGAGLSPRRFGGRDLVRELLRRRRGNGSFANQVSLTGFGVLALRASGRSREASAVRRAAGWLIRQQNGDGGFSFSSRGGASDVDDSGAVLQALAAAGRRRSRAVTRAIAYLRRAQNSDGGFGQMLRTRSNAQSTAWAVQGLVALGRDPAGFRGSGASHSPVAYLSSLQQPDGSFRYSRTSVQTPVWVTAQALAAVKRKPLPLRPVRRTSAPARAADKARSSRAGRNAVEQSRQRRRAAQNGYARDHDRSPASGSFSARSPSEGGDGDGGSMESKPAANVERRSSQGRSFPTAIPVTAGAIALIAIAWLGRRRFST
jgi:energy-coupling factor transport system substrate-specific component